MPLEYGQCVGLAHVIKNYIHHLRRREEVGVLPFNHTVDELISFCCEYVISGGDLAFGTPRQCGRGG